MLRKLPSVALLALGIGLSVTAHPAQGASYAGGASYRICPVPQECCGHTQYQLQRQTVLQNVHGDRLRPQQVPVVRTVYDTVMQPRTVTTVRNVVEQQVRDEPYTIQKPIYRTVPREVHYTVQRPGHPDRLEGRDLHGHPAGAGNSLRDPVVHRLASRQGNVVQDVRLQRESPGARGDVQGCRVHGLPAGPGDPLQDGQLHRLPADPGDLLQDVCLHGLPARSIGPLPLRASTPCRCRSSRPSCSASPPPRWCRSEQCAYKQVPYTVCRPDPRDPPAGMPLHRPGAGQAHRAAVDHLHGLPPGARDPSSGMPLHGLQARPDDHLQDGLEDLLPDGERDGLP